jgi:hypothetical protein
MSDEPQAVTPQAEPAPAAEPQQQEAQNQETQSAATMEELQAEAMAYAGSGEEVTTEEPTEPEKTEPEKKDQEAQEEDPAAKAEKTEAEKDQEDADNPEDEKPNKFWRPEDQKKFEKAIRQKVKYREQVEKLTAENAEKQQDTEILSDLALRVSKNGLPVQALPQIVELTSKALGAGDKDSIERLGQELVKKGWQPNIPTGQSEQDISEAIQAAIDDYAINGEVRTAKEKAAILLASRKPKKSEEPSAEQKQKEEATRYEAATLAAHNEVKSFMVESMKSMREEDKQAFIKKVDATLHGKLKKDRPETWLVAVEIAADFVKSQMAKPDAKTPPVVVQGKQPQQKQKHKPGSEDALRAELFEGRV